MATLAQYKEEYAAYELSRTKLVLYKQARIPGKKLRMRKLHMYNLLLQSFFLMVFHPICVLPHKYYMMFESIHQESYQQTYQKTLVLQQLPVVLFRYLFYTL